MQRLELVRAVATKTAFSSQPAIAVCWDKNMQAASHCSLHFLPLGLELGFIYTPLINVNYSRSLNQEE